MTDSQITPPGTYKKEDLDWQNAFGSPDGRPAHLLRQDALSELDKVQSPAYWSMKQNFSEIDRDGDGFLNPDEISLFAGRDPDLQGLAADRTAQFDIKRLVNDGKNDARGITSRDIEAYGARDVAINHQKNDPRELELAAEFLSKYFNRVSRSRDGFISRDDLSQLIVDPSLKFHFRQKFLLVERYFDEISELQRDKILRVKEHEGLSKADLDILAAKHGYLLRQRSR